MVKVHSARLVATAHGGGGLKRGDGEHHAGRHGLNKPKIVPSRGRDDQWRSDRVESLKLAAGLPGDGRGALALH